MAYEKKENAKDDGPDFLNGELAALMVMLLRVKTSAQGAYGSFKDQIKDLHENADLGDPFNAVIALTADLYKGDGSQGDKSHLFDAAHFAIRSLLLEIANTGRWGGCKMVTPAQIKNICNLS